MSTHAYDREAPQEELDERTDEVQHLTEEIATVLDMVEAVDRRTNAHDQFEEVFEDQVKRIKVQQK